MKLQGRDLFRSLDGPDVALLHSELEQLGFLIPPIEIRRNFFGNETELAVREVQKSHGLIVDGIVGKATAGRINAEVDALPTETFVVRGQVRNEDRTPRPKARVQAFDKDLRALEPLGEALTDADGEYEITYTADRFTRAEKGRADLLVRVLSEVGALLAESDIGNNRGQTTIFPIHEARHEYLQHLVLRDFRKRCY